MAITLTYVKSGRSVGFASFLGFLFALCALAVVAKTAIDGYRESKQAKWPTVVATIQQRAVRRTYRRGYEWHIETEVRYTVDGEELTSSIRSRVGSYGEEQGMYRWA